MVDARASYSLSQALLAFVNASRVLTKRVVHLLSANGLGSWVSWGSRGRWFESSPPDQKSRGRRGFPVGLFLLGISTIHNSTTLGINRARSVVPSAAWDRWDIAYIQNGPIHSKLHESSLPTWAEGEVSPNNSVTFPKGKPDPDRTVKRWGIID